MVGEVPVANSSETRAIGQWVVGAGIVKAHGEGLWNATLNGYVGSKLPAADKRIANTIADAEKLAFSNRQVIDSAQHPTVAYVKRREPTLALEAGAVLGKERVVPLRAKAAGVVNGFRPGVIRSETDTLAEAPCEFHTTGVVAAVEAIPSI